MGSKDSAARYVQLELGIYSNLPQVRALVHADGVDFEGLLIKHRGVQDWIVVAKRIGPDGGPQVIFGSGFDFIGALLGLEGSLASNRWRVDTPWKPPE